MSGLLADPFAYRRDYGQALAEECEAFLATVEKPPGWRAPKVLIKDGSPAWLQRDLALENGVDLIVLGSQGRSAVLKVFIGSVTKAILRLATRLLCEVRAPPSIGKTSSGRPQGPSSAHGLATAGLQSSSPDLFEAERRLLNDAWRIHFRSLTTFGSARGRNFRARSRS